jgi:hypothetical protein
MLRELEESDKRGSFVTRGREGDSVWSETSIKLIKVEGKFFLKRSLE